jgi:5-methylcytosine-specific restriction endonuclease McrA
MIEKSAPRVQIASLRPCPIPSKTRCTVVEHERRFAMTMLAPMLPPDAAAIDREAEVSRLGDEITELSAHVDAATARLLDLIREFDERKGWSNGYRSCADWLTHRAGLRPSGARARVRVARALTTLPLIRTALARGEISYAKVRAISRVATPETEERLLKIARIGTAAHVEMIVGAWRRMDRLAEAQESAQQFKSRGLQVFTDEDGMMVIRGRLTADVGAVLLRALEAARERQYQQARADASASEWNHPAAEPPTFAQEQADALGLVAEAALHHQLDPGAPGERYQVVVHVDAAVLADPDQPGQAAFEDGIRASAEASRRLACDASRVVMRHDEDGRIVEVGARTRTIPPVLRRALRHRDRWCRFPGCSVRFGHGHHIRHWAEGGPTTLSNLALLCPRHHRAVHEQGYQIERRADGALAFRTPNGHLLPDVPPPLPVPTDPVGVLRARHEAEGLQIDARTNMPTWLGEPLNVRYAIDVLHPLANRIAMRE